MMINFFVMLRYLRDCAMVCNQFHTYSFDTYPFGAYAFHTYSVIGSLFHRDLLPKLLSYCKSPNI
jgi:hypothetical protein